MSVFTTLWHSIWQELFKGSLFGVGDDATPAYEEGDVLALESGDVLLLESGDRLLLE